MADRYWNPSAAANWNATSSWSDEDGGDTGASVPSSSDDVFFTSTNVNNCTINVTNANCRNIDFTGYTGTFAKDGLFRTWNIYGNLVFGSGMTNTFSGPVTWRTAEKTMTHNGIPMTGLSFTLYADVEITDTFTVAGANSSTGRILVCSDSATVKRTITSSTNNISNADFRNIIGAGTGDWDLSGITGLSGDCGGNSNITFTSPMTCYAVRGAGNMSWSNSYWFTTSGGDTAARVPLPQDTAIIDANSFDGSRTLTQNMPRIGSFDFTGSSDVTFTTSTVAEVYGSINLTDLGTLTASNQTYTLMGRGTHTITSYDKIWGKTIAINAVEGRYILQDDLLITGTTNYLQINFGEFDANNKNTTFSVLFASNSNVRTIKMGSGTWTITGSGTQVLQLDNTTNLTFDAGTSLLKFTGEFTTDRAIRTGGLPFYDFENASSGTHSIIVRDSCSFNNFKINPGITQKFYRGETFVIKGKFDALGEDGNEILLRSDTTSAFNIQTPHPYAGDNSVDSGNNSGWLFEDHPVENTMDYCDIRYSNWSEVPKEYKESLTDVVSLDDSFSSKIVPGRTLVDVVSLDDSLVKNVKIGLGDKVDILDADVRNVSKVFSDKIDLVDVVLKKTKTVLVDVVSLDDEFSKEYEGKRSFSDVVSLSDSVVRKSVKSLIDEVVLVDKVNKKSSFVFSDAVSLSDFVSSRLVYVKLLSDSFNLSDSVVRKTGKSLFDNVVLDDFVLKKFIGKRSLLDEVSLDDVVVKSTSKSFIDEIFLIPSDIVVPSKLLNDEISLSDNVSLFVKKDVSDKIVLFDAGFKFYSKSFLDDVVLYDFVKKKLSIHKKFSDEIVLDDFVTKKYDAKRVISDEIILDDFINRNTFKNVLDSVALFDSGTKAYSKMLNDFVFYEDLVNKKPSRFLSDELVLDDDVYSFLNKILSDKISLDEFLTRNINKNLLDEIVLDESISKTLVAKRVLKDSPKLVDSIVPNLKITITQMQQDFINILHDIPAAEYIYWSRYEETEDEMGRLKVDKELWTNKIYIILQPLTEKDRSFLPQGVEVSSYMKAYTEPRYYFNNQRLEIEVGDVFVRSDGHKYMVETIAGKYGNFKAQVYRKLLLRGIDND
jgi:hypothetical protein